MNIMAQLKIKNFITYRLSSMLCYVPVCSIGSKLKQFMSVYLSVFNLSNAHISIKFQGKMFI